VCFTFSVSNLNANSTDRAFRRLQHDFFCTPHFDEIISQAKIHSVICLIHERKLLSKPKQPAREPRNLRYEPISVLF
jgi:hypothetical protein